MKTDYEFESFKDYVAKNKYDAEDVLEEIDYWGYTCVYAGEPSHIIKTESDDPESACGEVRYYIEEYLNEQGYEHDYDVDGERWYYEEDEKEEEEEE